MAIKFLQREEQSYKLLAIEKLNILYNLLTTLFIIVLYNSLNNPEKMLTDRFFILVATFVPVYIYTRYPSAATRFLRIVGQMSLLSYWYPDTFEFNRIFPNLDHIFAQLDLTLFGCQPAQMFDQVFSSFWVREAVNLGYFAYYPMIFLTVLLTLVLDKSRFEEYGFIVLTAFLLYYAIYLFVPVAGPQYYFQAIGQEAAEAGNFYDVGNYFRTHLEMRPSPGPDGFFRSCVEAAQAGGERPQAAFPSSHVGVSTVLMILLFRLRKWLCAAVFPFYFFLCCATVYIEAHYLVDVIGGLVSAVVFYWVAKRLFDRARQ